MIISSSQDYNSAFVTAIDASNNLNIRIDLRELAPSKDTSVGLTFPPEQCYAQYGDSSCYIARGRWDDGEYISIEYSNAYSEFARGYYMVVACSGNANEQSIRQALKKVKEKYTDAYIKQSLVYICCMH